MLLDKTINFSLTLKPKLEATNITFSAELTNDASTDNLELVASSLFPAASPIFVSLAAEFRRRFAPEVFDPKIKLSGSGASMEQFELAGVQFEYFGRNPDQFALVVQSKLTKVESAICFFRRVIAKAVADSSECSAMRTYMETSQSHAPPGAPPPQDPNLQARIKEFENARSRFKVEYEKRCISKP